jgi:hypothetical protein
VSKRFPSRRHNLPGIFRARSSWLKVILPRRGQLRPIAASTHSSWGMGPLTSKRGSGIGNSNMNFNLCSGRTHSYCMRTGCKGPWHWRKGGR